MDKKYDDIKRGILGERSASDMGTNTAGVTVSRVICDKSVSVDAGGDFELPEHMPEIDKLIKVDLRPSATSEFISGGGAQIGGGIEYSAIYAGSDGEIYCVTFPDEYSVAVPFDDGGVTPGTDKITVSARVCPDNIVSRVSGSSRINIK